MAVKHFDVMNLGRAGLINPEQVGYQDSIDIIKDESLKVQKSFVKIGWYLKHIRDNELYKENGYASVWECAADQLGYSQSTASRFINICEKFSKDHNSPELDIKYAGFDKSQMIEMLPMEPDQLDKVTPEMTIKQIREIKTEKKVKAPKEEQEQKADDDIPGQTSIENDFPEYLPEEKPAEQETEETESYATSHKNDVIDGIYREINGSMPEEKQIATSQPSGIENSHNEEWFVQQYVKICPDEASGLLEICQAERSNSDRAKAIQKHLAPYGYHCHSCSEYDFEFRGFSAGMNFRIGDEKIHLKYGRFAAELMKLMEKEGLQKEKLSPYGLPVTVYPEGSLLTTVGCGHKHNCFSCAQDCTIRQKDRYCEEAPMGNPFACTTMQVLENIKLELGGRCQFINLDMAEHTAGSNEPDPCCKKCSDRSCGFRCQRSRQPENLVSEGPDEESKEESVPEDDLSVAKHVLEQEKKLLDDYLEVGGLPEMTVRRQKTIVCALAAMVCDLAIISSSSETENTQPELPVLKNNDQRKKWLADYKAWGLWYRDEHIDVNYYKYDFPDGSRLIAAEYPQRYGYWNDKRSDEHYYHLLEKNKKSYKKTYDEQYRNRIDQETYLVEFLKNLQKKGQG